MPGPETFMRRALGLAVRGWGSTSPNPMVGAVLVKGGRVIGEGWHARDGGPHAEIECLKSASESPEGADLYVTLEPCSTRGRTGACCDAIAAAKIARVFVGAADPNPAHAGRARAVLEARGIECRFGILEGECRRLNFIFNEAIVTRRAVVALKYARSADGKIASKRGERTRITGAEAAADVMKWRALFQTIGAGFGTLVSDNPRLTSRIAGKAETCGERLIFDAKLNLAQIPDLSKFAAFSDKFADRTRIVCALESDAERERLLAARGARVMRVPADSRSPEFWDLLKKALWGEGISSLYLEGGALTLRSCAAAKAAEFAFEYENPSLILGGSALPAWDGPRPFGLESPQVFELGADKMEFGRIKYE